MGKVERFENLFAWQKARELTNMMYDLSKEGHFVKDFGLREQIRRASVSVMSNIAEGFDRANPNEFHQFLVIAKGSCSEVRAQLYVASDAKFITDQQFKNAQALAEETSRIISGLRSAVVRQKESKIFT